MSYRVVQWATGNQGVEAIRAILDRSDLDLVGAKVYSDDKEGVDAGVLAGREPCGVLATQDIDQILELGADCVAYFPRHASLDEVCRILASGANVTTTAFLFHPRSLPAPDLARLEAACAEGDSSVHGTGLNPGNLSGVLPLALSGMSRSIEKVTLQERADWSFYESTHITFDNMRFGRPAEEVTEEASDFLAFNSGIFMEEVALIGEALGAGLDAPFDVSVPTQWTLAAFRMLYAYTSDRVARNGCLTDTCRCRFARDYAGDFPARVPLTSIYSKEDGVVRWPACVVPYARCVEVSGSHVGLAFNRKVYRVLAETLAEQTAG